MRHWYPAGIFDTKYLATRLVRLPGDGGLPDDFSSGLGDLYDRLRDPAGAHALVDWAAQAQEDEDDGERGAVDWVAPLVTHAPGYEQYAVCIGWWLGHGVPSMVCLHAH